MLHGASVSPTALGHAGPRDRRRILHRVIMTKRSEFEISGKRTHIDSCHDDNDHAFTRDLLVDNGLGSGRSDGEPGMGGSPTASVPSRPSTGGVGCAASPAVAHGSPECGTTTE